MKNKNVRRFGVLRRLRLLCGLTVGFAIMAGGFQSRASAQEAAESTAITSLYKSLLSGVGKAVAEESIGWAMSAIGLAGGEATQLAAISAELQQIDADLKNINATLNEILIATEAQTCTEAQIAPSLQDAVNDITQLYTQYQLFVTNAAQGVPPSQAQVVQWQTAVLNTVSGVTADLNAVHNGVYATVNANVINECAIATATPYAGATKNITTFFDDRPSYSQLVDIVNYYYAVAVQGTTILVEAYYLQACQAAAQDDPNLHCDFTTVSTSTSASEVDEICDAPTDLDVQRACLAAQEAVTEPDTGTGLYERVEAWLKAAGAPYANGEAAGDAQRAFVSGELGLLSSIDTSNTLTWGSSYAYIFPKDLLDFTNNATINGQTVSHCSSPLTSGNENNPNQRPCGLTVGPYNHFLNPNMSYDGVNGHWASASANLLLLLLAPYNDMTFGDTSGTLGDFMYSIGFSAALKTGGLIVTTAGSGTNQATNFNAICFMDTSAPRHDHKQPWCDGIKGGVQGTDDLLQEGAHNNQDGFVQSDFTKDLAFPAFYATNGILQGGKTLDSFLYPGWFVDAQNSTDPIDQQWYWQYHWPVTNVSEIGCQNGKPYTNPGGLLSRCAGDLQEYVDALLPPPDSDTIALDASGDATLLRDAPNRNTGEDPLLAVGSRGANEFVVHFADERLERFLEGGELRSAILWLSLADRGSPRHLEIMPLPGGFVEGKGVGRGVTWSCAEDADVGDGNEDCVQQWPASRFAHGVTRKPDQQDLAAGLIGFDVTEDVAAGDTAWMIRSPQRGASGGAYHSREGARAAREPWRAPALLLERQATEAVARLRASSDR